MAYDPPTGIPNPATSTIGGAVPFGYEIDVATPSFPPSWSGAQSETQGYYYIDKGSPNATDSGNTYGYPDRPRVTPPTRFTLTQIAATGGALIYFGGGRTYTVNDLTGSWSLAGVASSDFPIWIVGEEGNPSTICVPVELNDDNVSFLHFRGINFAHSAVGGTDRYGGIEIRPTISGVTADHIVIQNCEFSGTATYFSIGGISIGGSTVDSPANDFNVESVVVQNCIVHTIGNPSMDNSEQCGVYKAQRSKFVWVLDSTFFAIGADAIAGAHYGNSTDKKSYYYFVGGNTIKDPSPTTLTITAAGDSSGNTSFTVNSTALFPDTQATATFTVSGGAINAVNVTDGGTGYRQGYVYCVPQGAGSDAILEPVVSGGVITGVTVISGGSGYTAGSLDIYTMAFVPESSVDGYKGFWKVLSVTDGTHLVLDVPYTSTATGRIEVGRIGGENGMDFKATRYVIASSNIIQGPFAREQGWGIVAHNGDDPTPTQDAWFIFNKISCCSAGIVGTSGNGTRDIYLVANQFCVIRNSFGKQPDTFINAAMASMATQGDAWFVDNSLSDYEVGINLSGVSSDDSIRMHGNIFNDRSLSSGKEIKMSNGDELYVEMDYDFFPSSARIDWAGTVKTLAQLKADTSQESHGLSGDPLYSDPNAFDLALDAGSPAIGASVEDDAYAKFFVDWGEDIRKDIDGNTRPDGGSWDMGAYEYVGPAGSTLNITTLNATTLLVG